MKKVKRKSIQIVDGSINGNKFLVVNHSRKTFHWSNSGFCYREDDKNGREVTEPSEKFEVFVGKKAFEARIPKGYKNDME